jgi:Peptidase family S51
MDITLLGPQRRVAGARAAVAELIPHGPVATINAGWRERESDTDELDAVLGGRMVNLQLYRRWQQLGEADPDYADAERRLSTQTEELRAAYQLRLRHYKAAVRAVAQRVADPSIRALAFADAVAGVRAVDAWHLEVGTELRAGFDAEVRLEERASIAEHRSEIARLLDASAGMVVTGGHVGVLLHLLQVFGLADMIRPPLVTWSAGAMALSPRVVLFADHAPSSHHDAEFYAAGLGLYQHGVPFPHARRRLLLTDPDRRELLAARLAPYPGLLLDDGVRLDLTDHAGLPDDAVLLAAPT